MFRLGPRAQLQQPSPVSYHRPFMYVLPNRTTYGPTYLISFDMNADSAGDRTFDLAGGTFGMPTSIKELATRSVETVLRIPGVLLLEAWWIKHDYAVHEITSNLQNGVLPSYLEMGRIIEFIDNRNMDTAVAGILSASILLLSAVILTIPLERLIRIYVHVVSLLFIALAHMLSIRYVTLERENSDPELKLDDFVKLERHGFYFLAQLMLALVQSCLLSIESDVGRITLAIFTAPIVARMCGCPVDKLIIAHNIACSAAMFFICIYMLNHVPTFLQSLKQGSRKLRALFVVRGIGIGVIKIWQRLRIAEVLAICWVLMFSLRLYSQLALGYSLFDTAIMAAIAETTSSPFTLLALALTVSYASQFVVQLTQIILGSNANNSHVLATHGYTEALTLVFLCCQAGVLGMRTEQKMFMLKLVLFIVLSALLQSLYEILEPQMLAFAAMANVSMSMHVRALALAAILTITPFLISFMLMTFLPMDLWFVMIISNCMLTSIRSVSTTVIYFLHIFENRGIDTVPGRFDDMIFLCTILTHFAELLLALIVVGYGVYASLVLGKWTVFSVIVLCFHSYFNVWRKIRSSIHAIKTRQAASARIKDLVRPTPEQLEAKGDVCMICLGKMITDVRITPCNHFFHGFCLKKWLFVKPVCPLCYISLGDGKQLVENEAPEQQSIFRRRRPREFGNSETSSIQPLAESDGLSEAPSRAPTNQSLSPYRRRLMSYSSWSDSESSGTEFTIASAST
uniref:RING-type domain-containing protein n=2 Tax=Panagrellus redivivus TaxID=6233 RepID=A0A7E4W7B1_PANRE